MENKDFIDVPFTTCIKCLSTNKQRNFISRFLIIENNILYIECLYNSKWITKKFNLIKYSFCVVSNKAHVKQRILIANSCKF